MSAEIADVLEKAAEVIETRGWFQGHYGNDITNPKGCKVCAMGAINVVVNGSPFATCYTLLPEMALSVQLNGGSVVKWNDTPGRTANEVIAALRNAATAERGTS